MFKFPKPKNPNRCNLATVDRDACATAFITEAQLELRGTCKLIDEENARRRAANPDDFACALHDHCDGNQVFLDALDRFRFEYDGTNETNDFVVDVWRRAQTRGFWSPVDSGAGPEWWTEAVASRTARDDDPRRVEIVIQDGIVQGIGSTLPVNVYVLDYDVDENDALNSLDEKNRPVAVDLTECESGLPVPPDSPVARWLYSREISTILAALRHWQETTDDIDHSIEFVDGMGPDAETLNECPLPHDAIDALCERLNCGD